MRYFRPRARSRRFLLICAATAVVVLAGTAAIAYAAYPNNGVQTMTGCLTTSGTGSGNLFNVSMGANPAKACGSNQTLVHLSGGTITQVTAGTGLSTAGSGGTGGSGFINNGFVTLGLLPGFSLPQNCTSGQVAKSSGSNTWACANDQNTAYSNGTGLDLNNNTFSINSNYQLPQNCTSGQFPSSNGAGAGFACGTDADTTYDGTDFATSGQDCPAHQFATGIDGNGNLKCAAPTIGDLQGTACSFNGHPSNLDVSTDNTTGAVSLTCHPLFTASASVTGGNMNVISLKDTTAVTSFNCFGTSSCSHLFPGGHHVQVVLQSGDNIAGPSGQPFHYTCPGGAPQSASGLGGPGGTAYVGFCETNTLSGDYAVTASFDS